MAPSTALWHPMPWGQSLTSCGCCRRVDTVVDDNIDAGECGGASAFKDSDDVLYPFGTSRVLPWVIHVGQIPYPSTPSNQPTLHG